MLFDGRDKMYLHTGWEKFGRYHDLQVGYVLTFSYLGDEDMRRQHVLPPAQRRRKGGPLNTSSVLSSQ
jgi:hypothetical protein